MGYCDVSDLRAEGVTNPPYSDPRCQLAIELATLKIDKLTGWFFEPRALTLLLDGRGHDSLWIGVPIIEVTKVEEGHGTYWTEVDPETYDVYNRHLSGQLQPVDDRYNPKIVRVQTNPSRVRLEGFSALYWNDYTQNVRVTGTFGFTDPDGTATGKTPDLIKWACMRLAIKELPGMASEEWDELHERSRVTTEKTRDQSITIAKPYSYETGSGGQPGSGVLTGDHLVDYVLSMYRRPPAAAGV